MGTPVKHYWLSCRKWAIYVRCSRGRVVYTAPIAYKFIDGPMHQLLLWAKRCGGAILEELEVGKH